MPRYLHHCGLDQLSTAVWCDYSSLGVTQARKKLHMLTDWLALIRLRWSQHTHVFSSGCSPDILFTAKAHLHPGSKLSSAPSTATVQPVCLMAVVQWQLRTLLSLISHFGGLRGTAYCLGQQSPATSHSRTGAVAISLLWPLVKIHLMLLTA